MFYEYAVTVPANTPEGAPIEQEIRTTVGTVTHVGIEFPNGCAKLARCQIFRGGFQLWPLNPDGYIASDGRVIEWDEDYEITDEPTGLTARLWNLDDTYDHVVTVRVTESETTGRAESAGLLTGLKKFLALVGIGG